MNVSLFTLICPFFYHRQQSQLTSTTDSTLSGHLPPTTLLADLTMIHTSTVLLELGTIYPGFTHGFLQGLCCSSFQFSVLSYILIFYLSSFCVLCQMLLISLNYPFLIASSNFFSLTCIHTIAPIVILIYLTVTYLVYVYVYVLFRQTQPNIQYVINQSKTCLYQNQPRGNGSYSFNPYIYIILIHKRNKQHLYRNTSPVCSKFINESIVKSLNCTLWQPTCTDSLQIEIHI